MHVRCAIPVFNFDLDVISFRPTVYIARWTPPDQSLYYTLQIRLELGDCRLVKPRAGALSIEM
jgi:hypothetical protein